MPDAEFTQQSNFEIRRLASDELVERKEAFAALLRDAVEGGGCVGFVLPLSEDTLDRYWSGVARELAAGEREVLAAFLDGNLVGSMQIAYEKAESVRHRADLQKLIVATPQRRHGIARALLQDALQRMPAMGLVMYTVTTFREGPAEALVKELLFTQYGMMPHFGVTPEGLLHDATLHYISIATVAAI